MKGTSLSDGVIGRLDRMEQRKGVPNDPFCGYMSRCKKKKSEFQENYSMKLTSLSDGVIKRLGCLGQRKGGPKRSILV
jgi:hypothetical protein